MHKVAMYIDGFNFYYAIKNNEALPVGLGWCDFRKLAEQYMLQPDAELHSIKYFTAPVKHYGYPGEEERQKLWIRAVRTIPGLEIVPGFYQKHDEKKREEKQTDVNIAVELLLDAQKADGYDKAILVTADIDLAPAVIAVQERLKQPRSVALWLPPTEHYARWKTLSRKHQIELKQIKPDMLVSSRLPDSLETDDGLLSCPAQWRLK